MVMFFRVFFALLVLAILGGTGLAIWQAEQRSPEIAYGELLVALQNNEVAKLSFRGNEAQITDVYDRRFKTYVPDVPSLMPLLTEKKVAVFGQSAENSRLWNILAIAIPVLLVMLAWYSMLRRQDGAESDSAFTKDKIAFSNPGRQVTFRDIAGIQEAKEELLEVVDFLQNPQKYNRLGALIPRGVLFQGPPGTGKTLLAKAVAGEAGVPFYRISGSDFVEMFVGVGASRVRELFREAKKNKPCIIFIDEIDAVGGHRGASGMTGGQEERGQTLNALLVEMDGFDTDDNIIVLAATNRPDILDRALLRPGRFDRVISILPPDVKGRQEILAVHSRNKKLADNIVLEEIARSTPGFSGAELASLVNEAALIAGRSGKALVDQQDFEVAKDRILMGIERKGMVISEKDRQTMAVHEAGHAIVARFMPEADPLHKITIIPRGRAMGHTQQLPMQDRHSYSLEYLKSRISILMGGRAAEEVLLHQRTTGTEHDLQQAIEIATNMIGKWGMSDAVGPLAYLVGQGGFLGEADVRRVCSEETARLIDEEVKRLVEACYRDALALLEREKEFLQQLSDSLIQVETLDYEEMEIIRRCAAGKTEACAVKENNERSIS